MDPPLDKLRCYGRIKYTSAKCMISPSEFQHCGQEFKGGEALKLMIIGVPMFINNLPSVVPVGGKV